MKRAGGGRGAGPAPLEGETAKACLDVTRKEVKSMEEKRTPQGKLCPLLQQLCIGRDCSWYLGKGCSVVVMAGLLAVSLKEQRRQ